MRESSDQRQQVESHQQDVCTLGATGSLRDQIDDWFQGLIVKHHDVHASAEVVKDQVSELSKHLTQQFLNCPFAKDLAQSAGVYIARNLFEWLGLDRSIQTEAISNFMHIAESLRTLQNIMGTFYAWYIAATRRPGLKPRYMTGAIREQHELRIHMTKKIIIVCRTRATNIRRVLKGFASDMMWLADEAKDLKDSLQL